MAIVMIASGCSTQPEAFPRIVNEPSPLPEKVRNSFGRMAILPPAASTNIHFFRPLPPAEVSHQMALRTYARLEGATRDSEGKFKDEISRIAFNALLAASVGGVAGLVSGVSEADFQRSQAHLRNALEQDTIESGIEKELKRIISRQQGTNVMLLPEAALNRIKPRGLNADFSDLLELGVQSVLDIRVGDVGFEYRSGANPDLAFTPEVMIYVIRTIDGAVLQASYLEYRGNERPFTAWAANDARDFRIEINLASRAFAQSILEQYFNIDPRAAQGPLPAE